MRRTAQRAANSMTLKRTQVTAAAVAGVHLLGVLLTALYVSRSTDGQAPLVWAYWMFIDLPWSLPLWQLMSGRFVLIHGVIGTAWWYLLVLFVGRLVASARAKAARSRAL
jgi:hypothetical protein